MHPRRSSRAGFAAKETVLWQIQRLQTAATILTCGDFFGNRFAKRLRDTVAAAFSRCRHDLCDVPLRQGVWRADAEKRHLGADPAVTNRGDDSQRGSFPRKSLHM